MFIGEDGDYSGQSISAAGDVDGDGRTDLLVSAGTKVHLILGSSLGSNRVIDLAMADYSFIGPTGSDGGSVASAGDVDGDGLSDLLLGGRYTNTAYLVLGSSLGATGEYDLSVVADYVFTGEEETDYAGYSVSSAGDVDGDGRPDLLIGSAVQVNYPETDVGKVYLILASSLGADRNMGLSDADYRFRGEPRPQSVLQMVVSSAGDVDGDGLADILVGTEDYWSTYLVLGASLGAKGAVELTSADYVFTGPMVNTVTNAGDVDGDGLSDVFFGADRWDSAYLVLGSSLGANPTIDEFDCVFEGEINSVAGVGDVDNNGYADLLIAGAGHVSLFLSDYLP